MNLSNRAPVADRLDVDGAERRVLEALPEAIICIEADGTVIGAWGRCVEIFGERSADVLGVNAYERVHPDDIAYAAGALVEAIDRTGEHIPINLRVRSTDGGWVLVEAAAGYLDEPGLLLISLRPLTFRGHLDERRAELQRRCLAMASAVAVAHGEQLDQALVNGAMSINEFFQTTAVRFCTGDDVCIEVGAVVEWPAQTELRRGTFRQHDRRGGHTVIEVPVPATSDARWWLAWTELDPGMAGWDGSHLDDLQLAGALVGSAWTRLQLEADLLRRSRHDPLTGLANRSELERNLQERLDAGAATVLFCDLDGYKLVNDRFGHAIGDRVLTAVAGRLHGAVRAGDLLARLGGDEFVAVCDAMSGAQQTELIARIEGALGDPIRVGDAAVRIGVSIGAATAYGGRASELLAEADAAMYGKKAARRASAEPATPPADTI